MGGHYNPAAAPREDQDYEAIKAARIPIANRDKCAHLLIPLNECRRESFFSPYACKLERNTYQQCLYYLYLARVETKTQQNRIKEEMKEAAAKTKGK
jgi:NADH dehydrogenase (ubiquinone) 1 beta subcomplex subunit 7